MEILGQPFLTFNQFDKFEFGEKVKTRDLVVLVGLQAPNSVTSLGRSG